MSSRRERGALDGVKVLDFSWVWQGPIATRFLGVHGATVIKLENPSRPDDARVYGPYLESKPGLNRSATFANYNTGKLSLALDLTRPEGVELARRLAVWADVIVENFRPGAMARLGLGYEELQKINQKLIMVSASMQGQTGPFARQPAFGAQFQGVIGFLNIIGWPDRTPVLPPSYPDYITPWFILIAVLAGLDYRRRTGKGQYIDMSMTETSLHFLTTAFLDLQANQRVLPRQGNRSPQAAPHGAYRCRGAERDCVISISTDEAWTKFCQVIGKPAWANDPELSTLQGRKAKEPQLDESIEQWTTTRTAEEVMTLLQSAGIPAGVAQNGKDLWADPQLNYRHHFQIFRHPESGSYPCEMPPFRLSDTPCQIEARFPMLGQDNHYICTQILEMSDIEFEALQSSGVFGKED